MFVGPGSPGGSALLAQLMQMFEIELQEEPKFKLVFCPVFVLRRSYLAP